MGKSLIHNLLAKPMSGAEIEARSFEIIDSEINRTGISTDHWEIVRRMIHTCGDPQLLPFVKISADAVDAGIAALKAGAAIYADSNMIRAGLSLDRLRRVNAVYSPDRIICNIAARDVADDAAKTGLPRSYYAIRKAAPSLNGGIAVFGNAPVALLEMNRMIAEGEIAPALVIGLPVGFVHVEESKSELLSLPVPSIVITGRRGGSNLAVSVVHALCTLAERKIEALRCSSPGK